MLHGTFPGITLNVTLTSLSPVFSIIQQEYPEVVKACLYLTGLLGSWFHSTLSSPLPISMIDFVMNSSWSTMLQLDSWVCRMLTSSSPQIPKVNSLTLLFQGVRIQELDTSKDYHRYVLSLVALHLEKEILVMTSLEGDSYHFSIFYPCDDHRDAAVLIVYKKGLVKQRGIGGW